MKKRAGIVSIYDNDNYGNRLQNMALTSYINLNFNVSAYSIYPQDEYEKKFFFKSKDKFKSLLYLIMPKYINFYNEKIIRFMRRNAFKEFSNKIPSLKVICKRSYLIDKTIDKKFDFFIVGSDQVWNLNWVTPETDFFKTFTLQFTVDEKKYSYAASMGTLNQLQSSLVALKNELEHFESVSVREYSTYELLVSEGVNNNICWNIDPVFLFSREQWKKMISNRKYRIPQKKYAVLYFLGNFDYEKELYIKNVKDKLGLEIIDILDKKSIYYSYGPDGFLQLIYNSNLVMTDSFHATAFSIIFDIPFKIFNRVSSKTVPMADRIPSLLKMLDLEQYIKLDTIEKPLTVHVTDKIKEQQEISRMYLKKIFEGEQV